MLRIDNITVCYNNVTAVDSLKFEVESGECVALIGANGAGKTTTLSALAGILPLSSGRVFLNGEDISNIPTQRLIKKGISLVCEGRRVFPLLTVEENLKCGAYLRKDKEIKQDVKKMYDMFSVLYDKRKTAASMLSGGQQQMLAVARSLMSRPSLLLLDEVTMGLSPAMIKEVFSRLSDLRRLGMTMIISGQEVNRALSVSQRAVVLKCGKRIAFDKSSSLIGSKAIDSAYL